MTHPPCHAAAVTRSLLALFASLGACKGADESARIIDLTASLETLRVDFDAHRGEARFLTLLSPT